jgi:hypothetical protein
MGWLKVDGKLQKDISCKFFFDENSFEVRYLKELIKNEFPVLTQTQITNAITESWKTINFPRPRQKFIFNLKDKLGGGL